jgi:hypothetical protein
LTYQGSLKNSSGDPVPDANYNLTFRIYNRASGGSSLWTSSSTLVTTSNGYFTTQIGPVPLPFDTTYYLSLQVQSDPEMTTRQRLTLSPYAASSDTANSAFHADTAGVAQNVVDNSITSAKIVNGTIQFVDIGQNGASNGQVMKWNGSAWVAANDSIGAGSTWSLNNNVLSTNGFWGIAKGSAGNVLLGDSARTMNNFGVACTTGTSYGSIKCATVGGGYGNVASQAYTTVGGGYHNTANGGSAIIGGGYSNTATNYYTSIGGGYNNNVSGYSAVVGGGMVNSAKSTYGGVASGYLNTAGNGSADTGAFIGGGINNSIAAGSMNVIVGGSGNYISNSQQQGGSVIGGGISDTVNSDMAVICGGRQNKACQNLAIIVGGENNVVDGVGSMIGGGMNNTAGRMLPDSCIIVGGGANNYAAGRYNTIGGGYANNIMADYATVGGGRNNFAWGMKSTIAGGVSNDASRISSTIGGGENNIAGDYSTVAGGINNAASGLYTMVGGGLNNTVNNDGSVISGGEGNTIICVAGGIASGYNNAAGGAYTDTAAFVGGGSFNNALGSHSTIAGGLNNRGSSPYTTIGGGAQDTASNQWATISGGSHNVASGWGSMIPGGAENVAAGTYSFAGGLGAHANHNGCFIYSDDYPASSYLSDRDGQTKFKSRGGVKFDVNSLTSWVEIWNNGSGKLINTSTGAYLSTAGAWTNNSDRNLKENFTPIDGTELLSKISQMSITRWNYKSDDKSITHIGPMAQDFKRLFEVGNDSTTISSLDPSGVALAGVQELTKQNQELMKKIEMLEKRISELERK